MPAVSAAIKWTKSTTVQWRLTTKKFDTHIHTALSMSFIAAELCRALPVVKVTSQVNWNTNIFVIPLTRNYLAQQRRKLIQLIMLGNRTHNRHLIIRITGASPRSGKKFIFLLYLNKPIEDTPEPILRAISQNTCVRANCIYLGLQQWRDTFRGQCPQNCQNRPK